MFQPQNTEIHFNSTRLYKGPSAGVEKHIPHEKYNPNYDLTQYDIGLIKLARPILSNEAVPVKIPTEGDENTSYETQKALVLGECWKLSAVV